MREVCVYVCVCVYVDRQCKVAHVLVLPNLIVVRWQMSQITSYKNIHEGVSAKIVHV